MNELDRFNNWIEGRTFISIGSGLLGELSYDKDRLCWEFFADGEHVDDYEQIVDWMTTDTDGNEFMPEYYEFSDEAIEDFRQSMELYEEPEERFEF